MKKTLFAMAAVVLAAAACAQPTAQTKAGASDPEPRNVPELMITKAGNKVTDVAFSEKRGWGMLKVSGEFRGNGGRQSFAIEQKIAAKAKETVKLNEKTVSLDEFNKMCADNPWLRGLFIP